MPKTAALNIVSPFPEHSWVRARQARWFLCMVVVWQWFLRPVGAQAQPAVLPITLEYTAKPGCPKAAELEAMVIARLGYDPFSQGAEKHVSVRITSHGAGLDGRTEWRDAGGKWDGDQSFHMAGVDCLRLTRTMGLALAVQLQLLADARMDAEPRAMEATETGPKASSARAILKPPDAAPPPNRRGMASPARNPPRLPIHARAPAFALGTGASVGFGMSSTPIVFGRVFGLLAWQHLSLQLGPELSTTASTRRADGAGFSQQLALLSAVGCMTLSRWDGCLVLNAGLVRMVGHDIDRPTAARVPLVEAGLRVGINQPLGRRVFVKAYLDGLTLLTRRTGSLDAVPVWTAPPFAAAVGLDVGLRFP